MSGTISIADRRHVDEPRRRPDRLAFKNAEGADGSMAGGLLALDEAEGIVTAVVSVTGVEDEVADIIKPGAYKATLARRNPKVCWAHSWEHPIGKVLHIEELLPGDERLPALTRDGKAWPREGGALVATMQFNMKSTAGAEAFAAVEFYSRTGECEYSIGYQVPPGSATRDKMGVRHIKALELYELSVVLFGAHTMTGTLSIKAAYAAAIEGKRLGGSAALNGNFTGTLQGKAAEGHTPPQGARDAAQRGLDLRREHGRGGTSVGIARARDIAGGKDLSLSTVKRMASFFARHEVDKSADGWGSTSDPSNGYIAWLLWGGDAGKSWAQGIAEREEKGVVEEGLDVAALSASTAAKAHPERTSADFETCPQCGSTKVAHLTGPDQPRCANCGYHVALREGKAIDPDDDNDDDGPPDFTDGVMVALYPDGKAADAVYAQIAGPDDTLGRDDLHVTLAYLGTVDEVSLSADEIAEKVEGAIEGLPTISGSIGGLGQFPDTGDGAPTWAPVDVPGLGLLREQVAAALGEDVRTDHGFTPHMTLGYDIGTIEPITPVDVTFTAVRVVYGTQTHDISLGQGAYTDERKASAYDPALDGDRLAGLSVSEVVRLTAEQSLRQVKAEGGADRNRGGAEDLRRYWTTGEGGAKIAWDTPGDMTRCIGFLSEHMTRENAAGYCANRHKEMTGVWPGDKANTDGKAAAYDPALDLSVQPSEVKVEPTPAGVKDFPYLTGTVEERMNALREAVTEALQGDLVDEAENRYEWNYVDLRATWDDRLIATRHKWGGRDEQEDWEMTYVIDDDGMVELGTPEPVTLQIVAMREHAEQESASTADAYPLADDLTRVIATIKAGRPEVVEGKAGRVLSGRNERRLRGAAEELIAVLRAAGVTVGDPTDPAETTTVITDSGDIRREVDPDIDPDSTSPATNTGRKSLMLTREQIEADFAALQID